MDTVEKLEAVRDLIATGMTQLAIAKQLRINQGYVSRLAYISTLPKSVTNHWTGKSKRKIRLSVAVMVQLVIDTWHRSPKEKTKEYYRLVNLERAQRKTWAIAAKSMGLTLDDFRRTAMNELTARILREK